MDGKQIEGCSHGGHVDNRRISGSVGTSVQKFGWLEY